MRKESVKGSVDLLHGPILKNLIIFMIPIFISNCFQQLYNAVDTAIVGHVLGENSLAAVGATASIFELLVGFSMSLGAGFSIVIARAFGSGETHKMKKAVAGSIEIGIFTTLILTILSMFLLKPLLVLIDTPQEIMDQALAYISVIGYFVFVMFAYNLCSGILRSIGNSFMPLVFLVFSSILNIFLDYACMAWFNMGVAGAAIATVISQGISAVLCIIYMITKVKEVVPQKEDFAWDSEMMKDLAGQGYAMALMGSIVSVGSIILQSGINGLGTKIIAGHVAARKVYALMNLPFISIGVALSTFIGQNKGSNQGERILRAMKDAYLFDVVFAAGCSLILWFGAPSLIHLISGSNDPTIIGNGSKFLYVVGPFYAVLGMLMQTRFALQGLGSKILPLFSSVIECVGKILFTMFLIPVFQYNAVIWCEPIIWCLMLIELLISFECNSYIKDVKKQMKLKV